jgi:hypothetical protein
MKDSGRPLEQIAFSIVPFVYLFTSIYILFTPPTPPSLSTFQNPTLRNIFSNFFVEDYLLKCTTHCRTIRDLPYELKYFAIITFDRGHGEKVPQCGSILLMIRYAPIEAFSNMYNFFDLCNIFLICSTSLQKPTVTSKCNSALV